MRFVELLVPLRAFRDVKWSGIKRICVTPDSGLCAMVFSSCNPYRIVRNEFFVPFKLITLSLTFHTFTPPTNTHAQHTPTPWCCSKLRTQLIYLKAGCSGTLCQCVCEHVVVFSFLFSFPSMFMTLRECVFWI